MKTSLLSLTLISFAACSAPRPAEAPPSRPILPSPFAASAAPGAPLSTEAAPAATEESHAASAEHAAPHAVSYLSPEASVHRSQSPINIVTARTVPGKHKVAFHYQSSKEHVDNLGHTVKVTYDAGSSLEYDQESYDLVQFHFHTPSEHLIDGITYPMEMHLVHVHHEHPERLLVVSVLFKEGDPNQLLEQLISDVPAHAGEHADKDVKLDASSVFREGEGYYHYEGSLTTPPYSETVTWLILDQVHDAAAEQIEALNRIEGNNARHIQNQAARLIDHWR